MGNHFKGKEGKLAVYYTAALKIAVTQAILLLPFILCSQKLPPASHPEILDGVRLVVVVVLVEVVACLLLAVAEAATVAVLPALLL